MTTHTFFGQTGVDGSVQSSSTVYATALDGTGTVTVLPNNLRIGQQLTGGTYNLWQVGVAWDTSSINDGDTIDSATISLFLDLDQSIVDFTARALAYDWTAGGLLAGDWRTQAQLGALTELAALSSSGIGATGAYKNFVSTAAIQAAINKTGVTAMLFASSRNISGTAPTGNELCDFEDADNAGTTEDPKLTVVTTASAVGASGGVAVASGVGASTAASAGSSAGAGAASGAGAATADAAGTSAGAGAGVGTGSATAASAGSADALATTAGIAAASAAAIGSAAGAATASGVGAVAADDVPEILRVTGSIARRIEVVGARGSRLAVRGGLARRLTASGER